MTSLPTYPIELSTINNANAFSSQGSISKDIVDFITNPAESLDSLLFSYNTTLSSLLDNYSYYQLLQTSSKSSPWFTSTPHALLSTVHRAENLYKRTHTALSWSSFKSLRNRYHNLILTSKKQYYSNLILSVSDKPRRLWQTVNKLLCRKASYYY